MAHSVSTQINEGRNRLRCAGQCLWATHESTAQGGAEYLIVATNLEPLEGFAFYKTRWKIETLFGALKSRGFNLGRHRGCPLVPRSTSYQRVQNALVSTRVTRDWLTKAVNQSEICPRVDAGHAVQALRESGVAAWGWRYCGRYGLGCGCRCEARQGSGAAGWSAVLQFVSCGTQPSTPDLHLRSRWNAVLQFVSCGTGFLAALAAESES